MPAIWTPILAGDLAARANDWLAHIFVALTALPTDDPARPAYSMAGAAGAALFFGYLEKARPNLGAGAIADDHLERAIESLASSVVRPSLYGGFIGTSFIAEHLQRLFADGPIGDEDDANGEIDDVLVSLVERTPWEADYDLISGLAGFAVYAVERHDRKGARRALELILDRLAETARHVEGGVTWWTPPLLIAEHDREQYPDGVYNVGLAHGVPAVMWTLAHATRLGIGDLERNRRLGHGLIDWLMSQRLDVEHCSAFPSWISASTAAPRPEPSRTAWCYGDPGTLIALDEGARVFGRDDVLADVRALARRAAMRPFEHAEIRDAGLCHGAAGLAQIWNRFHHVTGDAVFRDAARAWYGHLLAMRSDVDGIGGVRAWSARGNEPLHWTPDASFLTGASGVGLVLLAGLEPLEPRWDAMLMTNLTLTG